MTRSSRPRLLAAGLSIAALTASALIVPTAAQAAASSNRTVSGATLNWQLNPEVQGAAFFGGCQYFSAGESDGTSATYAASAGNVTVKQGTSAPSYATRCGFVGSGEQHVEFGGGAGTLNVRTGASTIHWTGSWSVNFYGGLAPFWIKNPVLKVNAKGAGTVTATIGGYASSQDNPTVKTPIAPVDNVVVAKVTGVAGANTTGFTVTPAFAGVKYTAPVGTAKQDRKTAGWGAWPSSFVDVHQQTGLAGYWYSSGSSTDAKKAPLPITVGYGTVSGQPAATPNLTVTPQTGLADGDTITVSGTGFDTTTPNRHGPGNAGLYVELGWSADLWQPSQGAAANSRSYTTAIWVHNPTFGSPGEAMLAADGSFSVTLTVDKAALKAKKFAGGKLSVFTVAGGGAVSAGSETRKSIAFAKAAPARVTVATGADSRRSAGASSTVTAAAPAEPVRSCTFSDGLTNGSLAWGFKESFRRYVSSGPAANSITASDGATVLSDGTFRWTLTDGTWTDATHYEAAFAGGVMFHYPAHFFDLTIAAPRLVVSGTTGTLYADVTTTQTGPGAPTTTTHDGTAFARIDLSGAQRTVTATAFDATAIGVTLADASAFSFDGTNFYQEGEVLDDAALTLRGCDDATGGGTAGTEGSTGASTGNGGKGAGITDPPDLVPQVNFRPEALGGTGVPSASLLGLAALLLLVGGATTGAARRTRTVTDERIGR